MFDLLLCFLQLLSRLVVSLTRLLRPAGCETVFVSALRRIQDRLVLIQLGSLQLLSLKHLGDDRADLARLLVNLGKGQLSLLIDLLHLAIESALL